MAERGKEFPLSIILRTVDRYTAGLKDANAKIDKAFKPYRDFGKEFGKFSDNIGLPKLRSALGNVGTELKNLTLGVAAFGAVAAVAGAHVFKSWLDDADELRDVAKRIGFSIDSLAQLRFVGGQEGVEDLDGALEKMSKNLGEAKAKSGSLFSFLGKVSPALRKQVLAAKSNEEAFFLFADAMAKIEDPAKRAAFATKVFGKSGQPLINMLANGSQAVRQQMEEYFRLAGSQEDAANKADEMNDSFGLVKAGLDRVKASIITGLAPAVLKITEKMRAWLADPENQRKITQWIEDFGTKLPGRIQALIDAIKGIGAAIKPVWDMIGGAKGALLAFVAIKTAPLVSSLFGVVSALTQVITGIRAASAAAAAGGGAGPGGAGGVPGGAAGVLGFAGLTAVAATNVIQGKGQIKDLIRSNILPSQTFGDIMPKMGAPLLTGAGAAGRDGEVRVKVDFTNAPKGARVSTETRGEVGAVDVTTGYQLGLVP